MKRLFALLLVGCLASVACAAFSLQYSLSGVEADFDDAGDTIYLDPAQTLYIGIATDVVVDLNEYDLYTGIQLPGSATWSGNAQALSAASPSWVNKPNYTPEHEGEFYNCWLSEATAPGDSGTGLLSSFELTFDGPDDTHISLLEQVDFNTYATVDSFTIVQTPEPISLSLLGLGALVLRRHRA